MSHSGFGQVDIDAAVSSRCVDVGTVHISLVDKTVEVVLACLAKFTLTAEIVRLSADHSEHSR